MFVTSDCTTDPYCDARKGERERAQTCTWCVAHTYEITRYFCHPLTPPRQQENAKGEPAHVHAVGYVCVREFQPGVEEAPRRGGRGGRGWNRVGGGRAGGRAGEEAGCLAWEAFISPEVLNTKRGRKGTKEETTPRRPSLYPTSDGLIKNLRGENNIGRLSPRSVSFLPIFESCLCQMFPPFFPFFFSSTRRGHFD